MRDLKSALVSLIIYFGSIPYAEVEAAHNTNAKEFNYLCQIYNTLQNTDPLAKMPLPDLSQGELFYKTIEYINISLSDDNFYATGGRNEGEGGASPSTANKEWVDKRNAMERLVNREEGGIDIRRVDPSKVSSAAKRSIRRISGEAKAIFEEMGRLRQNIELLRGDAIGKMRQALFGTEATKEGDGATEKTFQVDYATACGGAGGNAGVGLSLASDMVCLCGVAASAGGSHAQNAAKFCSGDGASISGGSYEYNQASKHQASLALWGKLAQACVARGGGELPSTAGLLAQVSGLSQLIGTHPHDSSANIGHYILGMHTNSGETGCTGATASSVSCVNYKHQMTAGRGIEWVKRIREAAGLISQLNATASKIPALEAALRSLSQTAASIYDAISDSAASANTSRQSQEAVAPTQEPLLKPTAESGNPTKADAVTTNLNYRILLEVFIISLY